MHVCVVHDAREAARRARLSSYELILVLIFGKKCLSGIS